MGGHLAGDTYLAEEPRHDRHPSQCAASPSETLFHSPADSFHVAGLLGSVSNLIAAEEARGVGTPLGFSALLQVGLPLTLITLLVGTAWFAM